MGRYKWGFMGFPLRALLKGSFKGFYRVSLEFRV